MALELILTELRSFLVILCNFCIVWSLCNQLVLQFSLDCIETANTCCGHIEDVHVGFVMKLKLILAELRLLL